MEDQVGRTCSCSRPGPPRRLPRKSKHLRAPGRPSWSVRPTDVRRRQYRRPLWPMGSRPSLEPQDATVIVEAQVTINGSKAAVWAAITNIENASEIISGIQKIEIVEKPANGLVGLR